MKSPAFQFYPDDFVGGVADMTQAEVGAYILLLCAQWGRGEIPLDAERAALIAKGAVSAHVMSKFPSGKNERLESVRRKQDEYRAAQANNGAKGASKRWHGDAMATLWPENGDPIISPMARNSSPSPSPSPSPDKFKAILGSVSERRINGADAPRSRPERPTIDVWLTECAKLHPDWPQDDARGAWEHYEQVGWKAGRNPVVKWKMCVETCFRFWKGKQRRNDSVPWQRAATTDAEHAKGF